MIRKQVYIEAHQEAFLKKKAGLMGVSEAELVRRSIENFLKAGDYCRQDRAAWEAERKFIASRMRPVQKIAERSWRREELYER